MLPWKIPEVVEYATDDNHHPLDVRHQRVLDSSILPGAVYNILPAFRHASYPCKTLRKNKLDSWNIATKLTSSHR